MDIWQTLPNILQSMPTVFVTQSQMHFIDDFPLDILYKTTDIRHNEPVIRESIPHRFTKTALLLYFKLYNQDQTRFSGRYKQNGYPAHSTGYPGDYAYCLTKKLSFCTWGLESGFPVRYNQNKRYPAYSTRYPGDYAYRLTKQLSNCTWRLEPGFPVRYIRHKTTRNRHIPPDIRKIMPAVYQDSSPMGAFSSHSLWIKSQSLSDTDTLQGVGLRLRL